MERHRRSCAYSLTPAARLLCASCRPRSSSSTVSVAVAGHTFEQFANSRSHRSAAGCAASACCCRAARKPQSSVSPSPLRSPTVGRPSRSGSRVAKEKPRRRSERGSNESSPNRKPPRRRPGSAASCRPTPSENTPTARRDFPRATHAFANGSNVTLPLLQLPRPPLTHERPLYEPLVLDLELISGATTEMETAGIEPASADAPE